MKKFLVHHQKFIILVLLLPLGLTLFNLLNYPLLEDPPQQVSQTVTPTLTAKNVLAITNAPIPSPTQVEATYTPTQKVLFKKEYKIAIYGDSMVDTMGEEIEYLQKTLKTKYPQTTFKMYNFGIGSQNVEQGLQRLNSPLKYKTRDYPPISEVKADIIILGSFAYNPFTPYNKDKHYQLLSELAQQMRNSGRKIYLLSEIAPLKEGFGKGKNGVNWEESKALEHSSHIVEQLENVKLISQALNIPLIDTFTPSQIDGKFGKKSFVNPDDGIHPSYIGHQFMAEIIASKIRLD